MKAYSGKDIQNALSLILHLKGRGAASVDGVVRLLEQELLRRFPEPKDRPVPAQPVKRKVSRYTKCPSCGRESFELVAVVDGLKRKGCRKCYYSEVVK